MIKIRPIGYSSLIKQLLIVPQHMQIEREVRLALIFSHGKSGLLNKRKDIFLKKQILRKKLFCVEIKKLPLHP
jgi:hypothetical protein